MKDQLPALPSDLIRLSIRDLRAAIASPLYVIDMDAWHNPCGSVCEVCLAGAVMAGTLHVDIDRAISSYHLEDIITKMDANRLDALDDFRGGHTELGLSKLGLELPLGLPYTVMMEDYNPTNPELFISDMETLANELEEVGY